jgi:hypothetical protein
VQLFVGNIIAAGSKFKRFVGFFPGQLAASTCSQNHRDLEAVDRVSEVVHPEIKEPARVGRSSGSVCNLGVNMLD